MLEEDPVDKALAFKWRRLSGEVCGHANEPWKEEGEGKKAPE